MSYKKKAAMTVYEKEQPRKSDIFLPTSIGFQCEPTTKTANNDIREKERESMILSPFPCTH